MTTYSTVAVVKKWPAGGKVSTNIEMSSIKRACLKHRMVKWGNCSMVRLKHSGFSK